MWWRFIVAFLAGRRRRVLGFEIQVSTFNLGSVTLINGVDLRLGSTFPSYSWSRGDI
jgi:hypothetical protein